MAEGGQPPQQQQAQPQLLAGGGGGGAARGVKREPELEQPMPGGDGAEGGHSKRLRTEAEADGGGMQVAGRAGPGRAGPLRLSRTGVRRERGSRAGPLLISLCGVQCVAYARAALSLAGSSSGERDSCRRLPGPRRAAPGAQPSTWGGGGGAEPRPSGSRRWVRRSGHRRSAPSGNPREAADGHGAPAGLWGPTRVYPRHLGSCKRWGEISGAS